MIRALAFLMLATPASAQVPCAPVERVLTDLHKKYGEVIEWEGFTPGPPPVEFLLLQSPKGTWTIVRITGAVGCLVATGQGGEAIVTGPQT